VKTLKDITLEVLKECCMCDLMKSTLYNQDDAKSSYSEPFDYNKLNHQSYHRSTFNKDTHATYNDMGYSLNDDGYYHDNGGHSYGEDFSYGDSKGAFDSNPECLHPECKGYDTCTHASNNEDGFEDDYEDTYAYDEYEGINLNDVLKNYA